MHKLAQHFTFSLLLTVVLLCACSGTDIHWFNSALFELGASNRHSSGELLQLFAAVSRTVHSFKSM